MSQQQVIDQRHEERRLERVPFTRTESCEVCNTEYEYQRDTAKWYSVDRMEYCVPVWVGRAFLCSDRCKSQHVYNISPQQDRDLMTELARLVERWKQSSINPQSHGWCVQHLHAGLLFDRADLSLADEALTALATKLGGEHYTDGTDDPPGWYCNAVKDIWDAPAGPKPVRLVPRYPEKDGVA